MKASCFPLSLESLATFSRQAALYFNFIYIHVWILYISNIRSCQFLIAKPEKRKQSLRLEYNQSKSRNGKAETYLKIYKI